MAKRKNVKSNELTLVEFVAILVITCGVVWFILQVWLYLITGVAI